MEICVGGYCPLQLPFKAAELGHFRSSIFQRFQGGDMQITDPVPDKTSSADKIPNPSQNDAAGHQCLVGYARVSTYASEYLQFYK